ncbi:iron uptake system EfeUOB component EfeO/EfeM [Microbacteriaceae bacterium SG_E_30_P1]|uniref:Iron uptake system EfeUOB component EfeO/EfeM n=1 Tax=Antiquaquibacter oligotrophicus TaxID=2880260 RepID=A0ABT6KMQ4_9MICO|nr:iron uptake system protein EfeO [Antiquaquibacter oligotrophicus]MDH6180387.1 iron uptake system EfeUOB component EfeO/EfeM [Antiquaquibacter oligotrophicus]UDF13872.1 EfeM/EfeO family lipoprotein [Antiquaquibacter oligotrophicus]
MKPRIPLYLLALAGGTALLAGCVPNPGTDAAATVIAVDSTESGCTVETDTVASGTVTFRVNNSGERITEFYLLGDDELSIVSEVENIAPGASRDLTVLAQPGSYFTVCKPGMIGAGIGQAPFTVTGETVAVSEDKEAAIAEAVTNYTAYVKTQAAELVPNVQEFVDAYLAGNDDEARRLFPLVRINYERIEPTAAQFGDLDPAIDYRKPGAEAEGLEFTGFHRIEMDLWLDAAAANYPDETITALDPAGRAEIGNKLVADVTALYDAVHADEFELSVSDITNGAIGLLDEVAAPDGKLPGEENEFAHTDLYDFYANVEGAEVAYNAVRQIALDSGADGEALVAELDEQFAAMKDLLSTYGDYESGFVFYDTVSQSERNELGAQLNALSEPLAQLTHAVLGVDPAA